MKKFVFALLTIGIITGLSQAQEIGVRFGDIVGNDVAVDFVFGSRGQRIHGDVSFGDGVGAEERRAQALSLSPGGDRRVHR